MNLELLCNFIRTIHNRFYTYLHQFVVNLIKKGMYNFKPLHVIHFKIIKLVLCEITYNFIGSKVSLSMKRAGELFKDSSMLNNTRTVIADYTEKAKALARRYWNILQTEAVKNIGKRF